MANKKENPNRHEFTLKREGENWTVCMVRPYHFSKEMKTEYGLKAFICSYKCKKLINLASIGWLVWG